MTIPLDNSVFKTGGVVFPLTSSTANELLLDVDPALYYMLKFYQGVIPLHLQDRWNAQVALAGMPELTNKIIGQVAPYPVGTLLSQTEFNFPVLSISRSKEEYPDEAINWYSVKSYFDLYYIMQPMDAAQYELMYPFLPAIAKVIVDRSFQSLDTNFNNGEPVWTESGLQQITTSDATYGHTFLDQANSLAMPTLHMTIVVEEMRKQITTQLETFNGVDGYVSNTSVDANDSQTPIEVSDFELYI